jgi:hypothetical protein
LFFSFGEKNQKNLNEGKKLLRAPQEVFDQTFFKKFAVSKGRALVARRNERNSPFGVFFLLAFSFAPFESKEKADKQLYVVLAEPSMRGRPMVAPTIE